MKPSKNKKLPGKMEQIKYLTKDYKKFKVAISQLKLIIGL